MVALIKRRRLTLETAMDAADAASWCLALGLVLVMLMSSMREQSSSEVELRGPKLSGRRPCDEIYVVSEGETLHTISEKCSDPYILEQNPHVNDPDDVYPGLVLKLTPSMPKKLG